MFLSQRRQGGSDTNTYRGILLTSVVSKVMGCTKNLEAVEQVLMCTFRMFFGVGTLHPKASLFIEMDSLPVVWEARVRCVQLWCKVLTSKTNEGRLLRKVAMQAVKYGRGGWLRNTDKCKEKFGWQDMSGEVISKLSESNLKCMLNIVWRNGRDEWRMETHGKSKLSMLKLAMECDVESSCAFLKLKSERMMLKC